MNALREREMGIRARDAESSDPNREAPEEGGNIGSYNDFGLIGVTMALSSMGSIAPRFSPIRKMGGCHLGRLRVS